MCILMGACTFTSVCSLIRCSRHQLLVLTHTDKTHTKGMTGIEKTSRAHISPKVTQCLQWKYFSLLE